MQQPYGVPMWNEKIRRVGRQITRPGLTAILWLVVIAGFALGIASLLVKELHGVTGAAATMLAASIAGLVALRLNETVEARRLRELRERRQEPYEALVVQLMGSFTAANADESKRRARVAVWGSPELIRLLTEWNTLVTPLADRGPVPIPPELRFKLMQAVAAVPSPWKSERTPRTTALRMRSTSTRWQQCSSMTSRRLATPTWRLRSVEGVLLFSFEGIGIPRSTSWGLFMPGQVAASASLMNPGSVMSWRPSVRPFAGQGPRFLVRGV